MDSGWQGRGGDDFPIEPLNITNPMAFYGRAIPERRWLWDGWVPIGSVTALYGDGGTGKSLLAQQLMTAVATGRSFLGHDVMPAKVLGVFCEDDDHELHRRQDGINRNMDIGFLDLENLKWISRVGLDNLLMTFSADGRGNETPFFAQVLAAAQSFGAQLLVVDTAADTFAGNENIRPQVRQFISHLTKIALAIDGAVILLAHPSQTGKASGSGDGGSTAWSNSVRSRLYLKRPDPVGGETPDPDRRQLGLLKANYAQTGVDLALRYDSGAFINETEGTMFGDRADVRGSTRAADAEAAFMDGVNELFAKGFSVNMHRGQANYAPKALRDKTKVCGAFSEDELKRAMDRLIKNGRIESITEGPQSRRRSRLSVIAPDIPGV